MYFLLKTFFKLKYARSLTFLLSPSILNSFFSNFVQVELLPCSSASHFPHQPHPPPPPPLPTPHPHHPPPLSLRLLPSWSAPSRLPVLSSTWQTPLPTACCCSPKGRCLLWPHSCRQSFHWDSDGPLFVLSTSSPGAVVLSVPGRCQGLGRWLSLGP